MSRLSDENSQAEKGHYPFSVFIFDLDHFKHIRPRRGTGGGRGPQATGQILRDMVRPDDTPARYGGEEFHRHPAADAQGRAYRGGTDPPGSPNTRRQPGSQPLKIVS